MYKQDMSDKEQQVISQTLLAALSLADDLPVIFPFHESRLTPGPGQVEFTRSILLDYLNNDEPQEFFETYITSAISFMECELQTLAGYLSDDPEYNLNYIRTTYGIEWDAEFKRILHKYNGSSTGKEYTYELDHEDLIDAEDQEPDVDVDELTAEQAHDLVDISTTVAGAEALMNCLQYTVESEPIPEELLELYNHLQQSLKNARDAAYPTLVVDVVDSDAEGNETALRKIYYNYTERYRLFERVYELLDDYFDEPERYSVDDLYDQWYNSSQHALKRSLTLLESYHERSRHIAIYSSQEVKHAKI